MNHRPFLSIIIPAYNEQTNFHQGSLDQVLTYLKQKKFTSEVILINDGSTDDTLSLLRKFSQKHSTVQVLDLPHQGKAVSIISGALASHGQLVLFSDLDQATPISEFDRFLEKFSSGADVVIGSRSNRQGAPFYRQVLAYGMIIFRTIVLNLPYRDTQCGFKAFSRKAVDRLFPLLSRVHPPKTVVGPAVNPGFDVEILYLSRKLGLSISQVPVSWRHHHSARVNFLHDAIAGISELLLVRYRSLTNYYHAHETA